MLSGPNAGSVIDASTKCTRLRISANDVSICLTRPEKTTILNVLSAEVDEVQQGATSSVVVRLAIGNDYLLAWITKRSATRLDLKKGDKVFAQVKSVTVKR